MSWEKHTFDTVNAADSTTVDLVVSHSNVDWNFLRGIYGWAAVQYQTWVRGTLHNHGATDVKVALHAPGVIELVLDTAEDRNHHFGVDIYGFQRAPIIITLRPGKNIVNVRLIRDVRADGGQMPPTIEASLRAEILHGLASIVENTLVVPDVYDRRFVSPYGSVTIVNHGSAAIFVENILVHAPQRGQQSTTQQLQIAPGQSRPLQFRLDSIYDPGLELVASVTFRAVQTELQHSTLEKLCLPFRARHRERNEPQKITFLHPSNTVSYAILLPPSEKVVKQHKGWLPIMVSLHGSGLDVDSRQIKHSFDGAPDLPAFLLFPTGMSPWCGDDWHNIGMSDIDAALAAIPAWLEQNSWEGPDVIMDRFLIAGHSNGGHGTWHYVLHQPDRIIAAAPASGYISVENYVPQSMWDDVDPAQSAIVAAARAPYRQELFLENMKGTPVLVQHGELDDNVPAYHSRLMKSLAELQKGIHLEYTEALTKFHWWDGAMTTQPMLEFYREQLRLPTHRSQIPEQFSFVVGDSHAFGSLHGIRVEQLLKPDVLGRVSVDTRGSGKTKSWAISTKNIRRFHLDRRPSENDLQVVYLEGSSTSFSLSDSVAENCFTIDRDVWSRAAKCDAGRLVERTGKQRGSLDAILRTSGPFQIVSHSAKGSKVVALQISRNLLQYFGVDSVLLHQGDYDTAIRRGGNVISITLERTAPASLLKGFPITIEEGIVQVRQRDQKGKATSIRNASSAIWLQPLENERLHLVVWAKNEIALRQAARLVPTMSGAGQPDFVVFEQDVVNGVYGKVACMGFFDFAWDVSAASYMP